MEYDFLKNFPKRMKNIGALALLFQNSMMKQTWKQYGFEQMDEQTNLIFSVLLFVMEQSLKEENCTLDEIGYFIDGINLAYYKKPVNYQECKELAEFIVTVIVCDEGRAMYFRGMDYEQNEYEEIYINFIANKIVYLPGDIRRTSYYLTEDGYNLLLSTLEIESNMKLSIQELIFRMHLEKASYDKAADDIKQIFNLLRIQLQKIQEAMRQIRQNALNYSIEDYKRVLEENLSTIDETKNKFLEYRTHVKSLVNEIETQEISVEYLEDSEMEKLGHLRVIEGYLNRSLDEYQKIFINHLDFKSLYTRELEALSAMSYISRFQFNRDMYQKLLQTPAAIEHLDYFLRPLFLDECEKIYRLDKALAIQKNIREREIEAGSALLDFDSEAWQEEQEERLRQKWKKYEDSIYILLLETKKNGKILLSEISGNIDEATKERLFPSIEIFREILIEMLKEQSFLILDLQKEQESHFAEVKQQFMIGSSILKVISEHRELGNVKMICVSKAEQEKQVIFEQVYSETGLRKNIRCSDILITVREGQNIDF